MLEDIKNHTSLELIRELDFSFFVCKNIYMDVNIWYDYLRDSKYSLLLYMSLELGQVHYYINYLYDKANTKIKKEKR